ncbi:MAG TPA: permease-like cell division protein FtsX [Thermoanaerobaculia bacterium]|nr:permease-like cell division protein FtsX [Thermoanaerobaculia bacterium]
MAGLDRDREPTIASRSTLGYFVREALRRIWLSKRTSFLAVSMITIALLILGSFLLVAENLEAAIGQWQESSKLTIYLRTGATDDDITALESELASFPAFSTRDFVSRDEALGRFKTHFDELAGVVDELDENPFPSSFEIEVPTAALDSLDFNRRLDRIRDHPAVDDVQFDWEWIARLRRLVHAMSLIGWIVGGILGVAAAFTIANVIRLTMILYREEIDIMRLVGATERIIRGPFLMEGILQGLIGGLAAVGLLWGLFRLAHRLLMAPAGALLWGFLFNTFLPWEKIAILIAGGVLAGLFGSWISVREWTEERATMPAE